MQEKRRFKRVNSLLRLKYTKADGCVTVQSSSTATNISLGGLYTSLSKIVKKGDDLLMELISPHDNKRIAVLSKVAWTKLVDDNRHNICGLKFLWVSSKLLLNECIAFAEKASAIS